MSQYIQFCVKSNTGEMLPIGTFSRSTAIYQFGTDYVPSYTVIQPLVEEDIKKIIEDIRVEIECREGLIEKTEMKLNLICEMAGDFEEKEIAIDRYVENLGDSYDDIKQMKRARDFYQFLLDMIDEAKNSRWYDEQRYKYDPECYIYAGVECARYEDEEM